MANLFFTCVEICHSAAVDVALRDTVCGCAGMIQVALPHVEFLEAVDPEIAIIGVGRNNYGHPADEVIEKLRENDIIVYRTDLNGAIGIRAEDGRIEVCTRKRESTHLRFFPRM